MVLTRDLSQVCGVGKPQALCTAVFCVAFGLAMVDRCLAQGFQAIDYQGAVTTIVSGVYGNEVIGTYSDSKGVDHGFIKYGLAQEALNYPGTNLDTVASGISGNNVVGTYYTINSYGGADGFEFNGTSYKSADCPLGYSTMANGISGNNIVGTCDYDSPDAFGFFFNGTTYTEINYPSSVRTLATGVSGNTVVGDYYDSSWNEHGFSYNGSKYQTLDYPGATYTDLVGVSGNYVVGDCQIGSNGQSQGFLYNGSTFLLVDDPLSDGGTTVSGTDGVNIVGNYDDAAGGHGFIVPISALPEPTSLSLLAIGGIAQLRRRRKW